MFVAASFENNQTTSWNQVCSLVDYSLIIRLIEINILPTEETFSPQCAFSSFFSYRVLLVFSLHSCHCIVDVEISIFHECCKELYVLNAP